MAQIDKPNLHFNTILYTGDGNSTKTLTGVGFQPDWIWIKNRTDGHWHNITDAVRGTAKTLVSNSNSAEVANATSGYVSAFGTDGFTVTGGSSNKEEVNTSSDNYVVWNWKANGQGSSNTDGSINTTYTSVNTTAGFSIVSFTGTGSNATVGHGLGVAPKVIITKSRANNENWGFYHESTGNQKQLVLNNDHALSGASSAYYNNTSPTSTVFSVGTADSTNDAANMVAYCFAEKKGYSKFGSYTGNGNSNGPFIYTGFKPAFFIMKETTDASTNWIMYDNKRSPSNDVEKYLKPNSGSAESTGLNFDFYSNGIKCRNANAGINASGQNYIYMAFAENPIVGSNNIPAVGR